MSSIAGSFVILASMHRTEHEIFEVYDLTLAQAKSICWSIAREIYKYNILETKAAKIQGKPYTIIRFDDNSVCMRSLDSPRTMHAFDSLRTFSIQFDGQIEEYHIDYDKEEQ